MNRAEEDYIKALWLLHEANPDDEFISNFSLASAVGHTPQSASEMIKKLAAKNYLVYKPYKGTALTDMGKKIGTSLIRRHRLWELFLVDILGYTWDKVHDEAERLEHVVSNMFEEKLYNYLGQPEYCPLGYSIPALDGTFPVQKNLSLDKVETKKQYEIVRVIDDPEFIVYISKLELKLQDILKVEDIDDFSNIITVNKDDRLIHLSMNVASNIFVKEL